MADNNITIIGPAATGQDPYQATVFNVGEMRVAEEPTELFLDAFDTGLDTVNRWSTPTAAGGGVAATNVPTSTQLGTGTTANGYSYLQSQFAFPPHNPGWLFVAYGVNVPQPYIANTYFFWGTGTSPATPTAAAPITDGAGWEIAVGGKLFAVMYQGGLRTFAVDLSSTGTNKQPLDGANHYYYLYYKGNNPIWALDNYDAVVASTTSGGPGPNVNTLPLKLSAIAGTSNPASSGVLTCNVVHVSDTTRNSVQLSDGLFGWRKATIDTSGNLQVKQLAPPASTTATLTSVVSSASTVSLLALNTARKGAYFFNDSTAILYIAYAATASTSAYTVQVPANSFFEMPPEPVFTGAISGIWAAANGNARITELT